MAASKNPMVVAQVSTALGWPGISGSTRSLPQPSSGGISVARQPFVLNAPSFADGGFSLG